MVISHGSQQVSPTIAQIGWKEELSQTTSKGDAFVCRDAGHQDFRGIERRTPEIQERQVSNEEIHGCVESRISIDQRNQSNIPQETDDINDEENEKEYFL